MNALGTPFLILWLASLIAVFSVSGAPLNDGSDTQTHSPIIAPDSESIIISEGDKFGETHHSDMYLAKASASNHTELPGVAPGVTGIDAAEIHHGDTYMMKNKQMSEAQTAESTTLVIQETAVTSAVPQTTEKTRGKNENSGAHPVAPVHHTNSHKKGGDGITKSVVAHSPVASFVEHSKSEKSERHLPSSADNSGSVVAHGPMVKNSDNHEKKHGHGHGHEGRLHAEGTVHSTVQHAPMATEHHSPKSVAHHPSLSKNVPVSSGHAPLLINPVVEEKDKTVQPQNEETTTEKVEFPTDVHSVVHAPTATDHHHPISVIARHSSLSKIDPAPAGSPHAPLAIPHEAKDSAEIHVEKRSQMDTPPEIVTSAPKVIEVHHPLLSKTEAAVPIEVLRSIHDDVKKDEHDVTSTTEINGNSLETQRINSERHPDLSLPATISPSS